MAVCIPGYFESYSGLTIVWFTVRFQLHGRYATKVVTIVVSLTNQQPEYRPLAVFCLLARVLESKIQVLVCLACGIDGNIV